MKANDGLIDVVVLAAGKGSRMKENVNKMFIEIRGIPVLYRTLNRLNTISAVNRIVVVLRKDEESEFERMMETHGRIPKLVEPVIGGQERSDSVRNGLKFIVGMPESQVIMTHDGARPFFTENLIISLAGNLGERRGSIPVLKLNDTIRQKRGNEPARVVDRESLFITQTPQAFYIEHVVPCFLSEKQKVLQLSDDASYLEKAGYEISMVEGEKWNIKITTKEDIVWAECLLDKYHELKVSDCDW